MPVPPGCGPSYRVALRRSLRDRWGNVPAAQLRPRVRYGFAGEAPSGQAGDIACANDADQPTNYRELSITVRRIPLIRVE